MRIFDRPVAQSLLLLVIGLPLAAILCDSNPCQAQSAQNDSIDTRKNLNFSVPEVFNITSYRQFRTHGIDPLTHRRAFGHFLGPVVHSKGIFSEDSAFHRATPRTQPQFNPWPSPSARPQFRIEGTGAKQQRELQDFLDGKSGWFAGYDCETNF